MSNPLPALHVNLWMKFSGHPDSIRELSNIVSYLKAWDFSNSPPDLIGAIYEELIDPADRHKLGQYFTPDRLVDLISSLLRQESYRYSA